MLGTKMREAAGLQRRAGHRASFLLAGIGCVTLSGCANFFVPNDSSGSGGNSGSGTVVGTGANAVYVGSITNQTELGFAIGAGTLSAVPNSLNLGYVPLASVVTRAGKFLYVSDGSEINLYVIGSDGSLSVPTTGASVAQLVNVLALDVSPDGQWLFGLDANQTLDEWRIGSDGSLATVGATPISPGGGTYLPKAVRVAPSGQQIVTALGTAGEVTFSLDTSNGAVVQEATLPTNSTQRSDNSIAIDSGSSHLYVATSGDGGGLQVFTLNNSTGALSSITGSPFATGNAPNSVAIDGTGAFVYVANRSDSTISAYSIGATGTLTAVAGSPFAGGSGVATLGTDSTGKYLLAAAVNGSSDLTMYSFAAGTGALTSVATTNTGTDPAGASLLALTH